MCCQLKVTKDKVLKQLESYKFTPVSQDVFSSFYASEGSVLNSIKFIRLLDSKLIEKFQSLDNIFTTPNLTISMCWENETEDEILGLEIGNSTLSYYVRIKKQETQYFDRIPINVEEVKKISNFLQQI